MKKFLVIAFLATTTLKAEAQVWESLGGGVWNRGSSYSYIQDLTVDSVNNIIYGIGCFDTTGTGQIGAGLMSWDGNLWDNLGHTQNPINCTIVAQAIDFGDKTLYWSAGDIVKKMYVNSSNTIINIGTATADVNDLCWWNGKLVAVGNFNKMNGVTCHGIAVYDTTTQVWSPLVQGMTFGSTIDCCYNWNGKLIIGGTFGQIDGVNCNSVAMYDTSGVDHWTNLGGGIGSYPWNSGQVYCFEQYNNELYVGCRANPASLLDFYKYSGTSWVNPLPTGAVITDVNCMKVYDNQLVIASFYSPGMYVFDGTNLNTSLASIGGEVYTLDVYNGELIAGGSFDVNTQGDTLNNIARWDANLGTTGIITDEIKVYPNPAHDEINLNYLPKNGSVEIHNLMGQIVLEHNTENNYAILDIAKLESGIYLLCINNKEGEIIALRKIIKQ